MSILLSLGCGSGRFIKLLIKPLTLLNLGYFGAFKSLYLAMKKLGIIGEIIFTLIGLAWLLWPMIVPYYAENSILYIPAVILTTVLCVLGANAIKN